MPYITSNDPAVARQKIALGDDVITFGRHPECEVIIEVGAVSRKHARINKEGDFYFLTDLGSRNGTILNGTPVDGSAKLEDGAEITICDVRFHFYKSENGPVPVDRDIDDSSERRRVRNFIIDEQKVNSGTVFGQLEIPSHHSAIDISTGASEKLKAIITVTQALRDAREPDDILGCVVDSLFKLFVEADRGFVAMRNETTGEIVPYLMKTRRGVDDENVRISRTIVNTVMELQQAVLSSDAAEDSRFDMSQSLADFRIRSMMAAPLVNAAGKSTGIIQIDSLRPANAFSQDELEVLATVAMQASAALQKFELYRVAEETRRMEQDLKLAHEVQLRFLPDKPPAIDGFGFYSYYRPATQVGGDYFDYVELDEHRCAVIVADVVGHGVAAALLMAKVAAESSFALAIHSNPVKAVEAINNAMSGLNLDKFVTFLLCMLDSRKDTILFVNAGHMPPIVCRPDGSILAMDETNSGLPVGIMEDVSYDSIELKLEPGSTVVLYTDGVNEAMNAAGDELTTERVIEEIRSSQAKTPEAIGKSICESIRRHVGDSPQTDDICLVCIGRQTG